MKHLTVKRWGALLLSLVLCAALAVPAFADEPIVYTSDDLTATRTRAEIGQRYAAALAAGSTYSDGTADSYYTADDPASTASPYAAGTLSADTQEAMTAMTNYYRWLVGVAPLQVASVGSGTLQKGALVRNFDFNHSVSAANKPADMDETLWNEGAAASHNILAWGYTPRGAVKGWLNEGYSLTNGAWDTIGHRMALLSGNVSSLQYGYSGVVAIGKIDARTNAMTQPFAAFPAAGDMPLNDVTARASAWSVELNPAVLSGGSGGSIAVIVTNLATGESYTCTSANGMLHTGQTLSFVQPTPSNGTSSYSEGDSYRVEITGLTDVATGGSAKIDYTVSFFDVRNYTPAVVTSCTPTGWNKLYVPKRMNSETMLGKIALILPKTVDVKTSVGRTLTLPVSGTWQVDMDNGCWTNSVDAAKLPAEITDPNGVLSAVTLPWDFTYAYTGALTATGANGKAGTSGTFTMNRYNISYTQAELYQLTQDADGSLRAELRFDNASANFSTNGNRYLFDMDPWQVSDSGEWLGIYYSKESYWTDAYLAGNLTASITCDHVSTTLVGAKEPSETEEGYTGDEVCDVCGEIVKQGEVIPMLVPARTLTLRAVEEATGAVLDEGCSGLRERDGVVTENPVAPSYLGYEVCGWQISTPDGSTAAVELTDGILTAEALNRAIDALVAESEETAVTVTALYVRTADTYTVDLSYTMPDGTLVKSYTTDPYLVGDAAKLTTSETFVDGDHTYYFDHWLIDGKQYPTLSVTVRPSAGGSYAATAVYSEQQKDASAPLLAVVDSYAETVNGIAKTGVTLT